VIGNHIADDAKTLEDQTKRLGVNMRESRRDSVQTLVTTSLSGSFCGERDELLNESEQSRIIVGQHKQMNRLECRVGLDESKRVTDPPSLGTCTLWHKHLKTAFHLGMKNVLCERTQLDLVLLKGKVVQCVCVVLITRHSSQ